MSRAGLAWMVWALAALFFFYAFFQRVAPSVMVAELMRDFGVGAAGLGNLAAFYFYAYAGMQLPVGMAHDAWGPRRVLCAAALVCGAGSLLFATADGPWAANLGRLLVGGGAAFGFVGALKLATAWFPPRRFALMSGLTMMIGMAGGVAGQAPLAAVIGVTGWRDAMTGAALFILVLAPVYWLVVRDHPGAGAQAPRPESGGGAWRGLGRVVTTPQVWIIGLFGICMGATLLAFGGLWGVPYLMQAFGLERPAAAAAASLMLIGWALGAPLAGWVSDHIGRRRRPMLVAAVVALASFTVMIYLPGLPLGAVRVLLFVNGAASGAAVVCFATARENAPAQASGAAMAFINMAMTASGALFQPLVGWFLDLAWDGRTVGGARLYSVEAYHTALLAFVGLGVLAIGVGLMMRETHCRGLGEVD